MSNTYSMFIEPTITGVHSGFFGYIWVDMKIVLKTKKDRAYSFIINKFKFEFKKLHWMALF